MDKGVGGGSTSDLGLDPINIVAINDADDDDDKDGRSMIEEEVATEDDDVVLPRR